MCLVNLGRLERLLHGPEPIIGIASFLPRVNVPARPRGPCDGRGGAGAERSGDGATNLYRCIAVATWTDRALGGRAMNPRDRGGRTNERNRKMERKKTVRPLSVGKARSPSHPTRTREAPSGLPELAKARGDDE